MGNEALSIENRKRALSQMLTAPGPKPRLASLCGSTFSLRSARFFSLTTSEPVLSRGSNRTVRAAFNSRARLNCLSDFAGVSEYSTENQGCYANREPVSTNLPASFVLDQQKRQSGRRNSAAATGFQQFQKHHVAHPKTERWQVHFAAAEQFDQIVVTSAAGNRPKFAFSIKGFEDRPGVIGQPANNVIIDLHEILQPAVSEITENRLQFTRRLAAFDEWRTSLKRKPTAQASYLSLRWIFAFQLIDRLVKLVRLLGVALPGFVKMLPRVAAAEANHKILCRQPKGAQGIDQQRNQFRISRRIIFANDIRIELESVPAAGPFAVARNETIEGWRTT